MGENLLDLASGKGMTEAMMSLELVSGGDLTTAAPASELQRILECPVCKTLPLPPIYNCTKGHIICGKCRPQMHKCCLCQSQYTDSRNFTVEEIVETSRIACEYREQGCQKVLNGKDFAAHVNKNCQYRPIKCYRGDSDGCNNSLVDLLVYKEHLLGVHNMKEHGQMNGSFAVTHSLSDSSRKEARWTGISVMFDERTFITRSFLMAGFFHLSLCVVGTEAEAKMYKVCMQFRRAGSNTIPFEVTMPVTTIRASYEEISVRYLHAILTKKMIKSFSMVEEKPSERKRKYKWVVNYKITKNES